jgi:hypothetical protein
MKATQSGPVIGQALQAFDGTGTGTIYVFVRAGYFNGTQVSSVYAQSPSSSPSATPTPAAIASSSDGLSATVSGDLRVQGNGLFENVLHVVTTLMTNNFIVNGIAEFFGNVLFHGDVAFEHAPTFTQDTAGYAVIHKGDSSVTVAFSSPRIVTPVVNATRVAFMPSVTPGSSVDPLEGLQQMINGSSYTYIVTNVSATGFTILLSKPAENDMAFSWNALLIPSVTPAPITSFDTSTNQSVAGATTSNVAGAGDGSTVQESQGDTSTPPTASGSGQ